MSVLVVGSFICDLVARCERAPEAGETVTGLSFNSFAGGKGANQAVAARRIGAAVEMIGCVGNDSYGENFLKIFANEGIGADGVKTSALSTGCSLVTVETSGQNRICMVPGANLDYGAEELFAREYAVERAHVVVTQCEMRPEIVDALAHMCKVHNKKLIINPAPARTFSDETLSAAYAITPNETELGVIVGRELVTDDDYVAAARELIEKGVRYVIVTLGSRGCLFVDGKKPKFVPSFKVKAVDTVGAGDSFTGSFAALIDEGIAPENAITVSSAVGALSVTRQGAIPSMPTRSEVVAFLRERGIKFE